MVEIGFVGLGAMGTHPVRHLLASAFRVHVLDTNDEAVASAVALGAPASPPRGPRRCHRCGARLPADPEYREQPPPGGPGS
ncbi:NAD(P)-binding domain-containing protein [Sphingomonas arantia]|uniref:NAD(P)-binding domain-containing protein n=1 Tax=Sphingomonas arantia TaxID=1460676 RepID=A0ABW4U1N4_9SPHN